MKSSLLFLFTLALLAAAPGAAPSPGGKLDGLAEAYVKLALEIGSYSPGYIDAYYGPKEWQVADKDAGARRAFPAAALRQRADAILSGLDKAARDGLAGPELARADFLRKQTIAVRAQVEVLAGMKLSFDEESRLFYDAVLPAHAEKEFAETIAALEAELPGPGPLQERLAAFKKEFFVPADRLPAVFAAAIAECRRRTLLHIPLPENEDFKAEYVKDKPWGAYNWYKGNAFSVIEVNTDLPFGIDSPVRLAAHEGYPGHHAYNALLEQKLARGRGWIEFTVYPLFSPQSLIAEGTANYGLELLFPGGERLEFEKRVLYPLAGLDPGRADAYDRVQRLARSLGYAENEAARRYLDGALSREAAIAWMERYALESSERAARSVDFWNAYRSYVINYTLGEDIVRAHVERSAGADGTLAGKWRAFQEILVAPTTPSALQPRK